ncbi:hydrogenase maturation protein [Streptomyces sp. A7024]|uniref:Hydrogenase maturation protein n=1 Tax=Streptomyces coryli TaxID=1128680 RepID=A0A6G4TU11_9ACTN|nr:hydrogenase maturation protein [Streptomyces coryli]
MRILLVASAYNSLTQRVDAELTDRGHTVASHVMSDDDALRTAIERHLPHLIVAPMLKTALPEDVWASRVCLIVHPGPVGDRGPSSLDWAITEGADRWGVTVLQAAREFDAGDVWASVECPLPRVAKSDLYRGEIADAALAAVHLAVERFALRTYVPEPLESALAARAGTAAVTGGLRPYLRQHIRSIDWALDSTEIVLRKLRAADSFPGVLDELDGREFFLYGGHEEDELRGRPGELLARRAGAVCRATADGAVWLTQLRPRRTPGGPATYKVPATLALGPAAKRLPEVPAPLSAGPGTWTDIRYRERGSVGYLHFSFPSGGMATAQCARLLSAYEHAWSRPTDVLVLGGTRDFFSNGIHLGVIEAAPSPADESWRNINAMNDLVHAVLTTTDKVTVAALGGNAAAGGVMLALAADEVWAREGVVLNPHYRKMGLTGSEYWTYTLPLRTGVEQARSLLTEARPVSARRARELGLVDYVIPASPDAFTGEVEAVAERMAGSPELADWLRGKADHRAKHEEARPLAAYRENELAKMRQTFYDPGAEYHRLRYAFMRKL